MGRRAGLPVLVTVCLLLVRAGRAGAQPVLPPATLDGVDPAVPPEPVALPIPRALRAAVPSAAAGADSSARHRPPRDNRIIVSQALAGGLGGIGGVFVATIPYALSGLGGRKVNDTPFLVAAGAAYVAGTVAGVHRVGKDHGLRGSIKATLVGAAAGLLGGPAVLVTFPLGATVGYQRTRAYREDPGPPRGPLDAPGAPPPPAGAGD